MGQWCQHFFADLGGRKLEGPVGRRSVGAGYRLYALDQYICHSHGCVRCYVSSHCSGISTGLARVRLRQNRRSRTELGIQVSPLPGPGCLTTKQLARHANSLQVTTGDSRHVRGTPTRAINILNVAYPNCLFQTMPQEYVQNGGDQFRSFTTTLIRPSESSERSQCVASSSTSMYTTTSGTTILGLGADSGRLLIALGKMTLRGIESIIIRRRLSDIRACSPYKDGEVAEVVEQINAADLLELSRLMYRSARDYMG